MGAHKRKAPGVNDGQRVPAAPGEALSRTDLLRRAAVAGAAVASTSAWAPAALAAPRRITASSPKTLVVGTDAVGIDFVPAHSFQGWGHTTALIHMLEGLYTYPDWDIGRKVVPVLARDFPRRDARNKRKFAVDLKKGVRFHDGTPLDAESVVFNYMRYLDKNHPFYDPAAVFTGGNILFGIAKVEALDSDTVVFTTNRPLGDFKAQLVSPLGGGLLSVVGIRQAGVPNAGVAPQGTGPFRLVEARKGDQIVLERFEGYHGPRPGVDRIVLRAIPDPAALTAAILSGDVHLSWQVSLDDVPRFQRDNQLTTSSKTSLSAGYVALNAGGSKGVKTFLDQRLRIAALTALNKQKLIQTVLGGRAKVGAGLVAPALWGYQPQLIDFHKYNPSKARTLLSQVGDVPAVTLSVPSNAHWPRAAESVQADWEAVGIKTTIKVIDSAAFGATMSQGAHDAFMWDATPGQLESWSLYRVLFGCSNPFRFRVGGWCDQEFDRALLAAVATNDRKKAKGLIALLDRKLLEAGAWQANYYPDIVSVWRKNVSGFNPPVLRFASLNRVTVK